MKTKASVHVPLWPTEGDLAWLRRLAGRLVRDGHAADDLSQDVCVAALESTSRPPSTVRGFWRTVMVRQAGRRTERERKRGLRERACSVKEALPPADRACQRIEIQGIVARALGELDEIYRTALYLRYYEDLPPRRIALQLGVPVATVKQRLRRGLATLRARLDRERGGRGAWLEALAPIAASGDAPLGVLGQGALLMKAKLALGSVIVVLAAILTMAFWPEVEPMEPSNGTASDTRFEEVEPRSERAQTSHVERVVTPGNAEAETQIAPSPVEERRVEHRITVRVLDMEGRAVAGAAMDLWLDDRAHAMAASVGDDVPPTRALDLGPEGFARLEDLPDRFVLRPSAPDHMAVEFLYAFHPDGEELGEHVLRLARANTVQGVVRDDEHRGLGRAEITISLRDAHARQRPTAIANLEVRATYETKTIADQAGGFAFEGPAGELVDLNVRAEGYRNAYRLVAPDDRVVEILMQREQPDDRVLRGRVEDGAGRAIPGAAIVFERTPVRAISDAEGRFRIVDPPLLDALHITRAGYRVGRFHFERSWLTEEVPFVLEEGVVLAGRVVTMGDEPVPDVVVEARFVEGEATGAPVRVERTDTDARGRFHFPGVRSGAYVVRAVRDGATLAMRPVHAPDDAIVLRVGSIEPGVVSLAGRVIDGLTDLPLRGARVQITASMGGTGLEWRVLAAVSTDDEGFYRLEDVAWDAVMIDVTCAGYVSARVQPRWHPLGETNLDVTLHPERELDVLVVDVAGRPVSEVSVMAFDASGRQVNLKTGSSSFSLWIHTGPEGKARLRGLPADRVHLHASTQHAAATDPLEVDLRDAIGEPVVLRLATYAPRLTRSVRFVPSTPANGELLGEVVLRVLDHERRSVLRVRLVHDGSGWAYEGVTRRSIARGGYLTVKVPEGEFTVEREATSWSRSVDALADTVPLDFTTR